MTKNEYALFLIQEMYGEWFKKPDSYKSRSIVFRMQSYQNWAIRELLDYLYNHGDGPIIETIEEFRAKLDTYAAKAKSEEQNFIFSSAYDAVSCVLDVLRNVE